MSVRELARQIKRTLEAEPTLEDAYLLMLGTTSAAAAVQEVVA